MDFVGFANGNRNATDVRCALVLVGWVVYTVNCNAIELYLVALVPYVLDRQTAILLAMAIVVQWTMLWFVPVDVLHANKPNFESKIERDGIESTWRWTMADVDFTSRYSAMCSHASSS